MAKSTFKLLGPGVFLQGRVNLNLILQALACHLHVHCEGVLTLRGASCYNICGGIGASYGQNIPSSSHSHGH